MINNFYDKKLAHFWSTGKSGKIPAEIHNSLKRKLKYLDAAMDLTDLRIPPANRLEALKGDLKGHHSIQVNDQWRLVFRWQNDSVCDLKLVDYHK